MSTITVVKKNGVAAIAADTLTKWGYAKESATYVANHEKILRLGDSYVGVAGSATAEHAIRDYFSRRKQPPRLATSAQIFRTFTALHGVLKEEYFLNPKDEDEDSYESSRSDVLILNEHGIFGVDAYRCVQEFTKFYAYGGGCEYALGAMYAVYDSELSAEEIARLGVEASAEFDDSTGLPITSYTVRLKAPRRARAR